MKSYSSLLMTIGCFLSLICNFCVYSNKGEPPDDISVQMSPLVDEKALKIKFINNMQKYIRIPFRYNFGIKSLKKESTHSPEEVLKATVIYQITDSSRKIVFKHQYNLFPIDSIDLPSGGEKSVVLPISVPVRTGYYKLSLIFDNSNLGEAINTHNYVPPGDENIIFLKKELIAAFEIK